MRHVREDDLIRVIAAVSTVIVAMDIISGLVDNQLAQALRRYRQQLVNAVEDMQAWFNDDYKE